MSQTPVDACPDAQVCLPATRALGTRVPERELVAREPVVHTRDAIAAELQRSPASVLVSYCSDWQQRERDKRGRDEESDEDKNRWKAFPLDMMCSDQRPLMQGSNNRGLRFLGITIRIDLKKAV